jgi:methanogenic corrinoid protein MtbC1
MTARPKKSDSRDAGVKENDQSISSYDGDHQRAAEPPVSDNELLPIVQSKILPGLHLKYQSNEDSQASDKPVLVSEQFREQFVGLLLESDVESAWDCIQALREQGASHDWIILDLFTRAAQRLGVYWEEDVSNFADVTIAMSHLGTLLRRNSEAFLDSGEQLRISCRILMAPTPNEQHTFGLNVAGEYFLRAGYDVSMLNDCSLSDLVSEVKRSNYDVVGLSLGSIKHEGLLAETIQKLRRVSRNRHVCIVVGGPLFDVNPGLSEAVGADMLVADVRYGPATVSELVKKMASQ